MSRDVPERIGILIYPGVEPMDFQGPLAIFDLWHLEAAGPAVVTVGEHREGLRCAYGRPLSPEYDFEDCPPCDAWLIPGGKGRREAIANRRLLEFLAQRGAAAQHLLSVCTGISLLHAAGLVQRQRVTTHWEFTKQLAESSDLTVLPEARFVQDGPLWTGAGIFAGIDLALAFIASFAAGRRPDGTPRTGDAGQVQLFAQYYPAHTVYDPAPAAVPEFLRPLLLGSQKTST